MASLLADTKVTMNVTLKYVDPERLRCSVAFCKYPGDVKNFMMGVCSEALSYHESPTSFHVKLYLCDYHLNRIQQNLPIHENENTTHPIDEAIRLADEELDEVA